MKDSIILLVLRPEKTMANSRSFEHLGIAHLASALRAQHYPVQIIDQNLSQKNFTQLIEEVILEKPRLIGISCYQTAYLTLVNFVRAIKAKIYTHITLGGVFATNSYQKILSELPELDSIVLGEAETTIVELADAIFNQQAWNEHPHITYFGDPLGGTKTARLEPDLDILPRPARDTLPLVLNMGLYPEVISSRGCYGKCAYCTIAAGNRKRRTRQIESVLDEMEYLQKDFNTDYFYIIDDTFIGASKKDHSRIEQFARVIKERNLQFTFSFECRANEVEPDLLKTLQEVGLRSVFLGIESGYDPTLKFFQKGITAEDNERAIKVLQELGIGFNIGYIMFHPYTTMEEIRVDMEFLLKTDQRILLNSLRNQLYIFHNTPIAERVKADGFSCEPWYNIIAPFFNPGVQELYEFIVQFHAEIRPTIDQLARQFTTASAEDKIHIGTLYSRLCSTLVDTIFTYTNTVDTQLLKNRLLEMRGQITTKGGDSHGTKILGS